MNAGCAGVCEAGRLAASLALHALADDVKAAGELLLMCVIDPPEVVFHQTALILMLNRITIGRLRATDLQGSEIRVVSAPPRLEVHQEWPDQDVARGHLANALVADPELCWTFGPGMCPEVTGPLAQFAASVAITTAGGRPAAQRLLRSIAAAMTPQEFDAAIAGLS